MHSTGDLCVWPLLDSSGAGADFVMMGGMLAGHDQCSGEVIEKNGKKYKLFYGMSSDTAMKKYVGGVAEYRWEVTGYTNFLFWGPPQCSISFHVILVF